MKQTEKVIQYWETNGYIEKSMTNSTPKWVVVFMPKWVVVLATILVFAPCDLVLSTINVCKKWIKYLQTY